MGDEELAALVRPELEPYAGTVVVVGHGVACYGAADRYLGMLAATLGDWEVAEARFDAALDLNRRMGAADLARPHGVSSTAGCCTRAAARRTRAARPRCSPRPPRSPSASGCRRSWLGSTGSRSPVAAAPPPDGLSPREVDILRLVARGLSNRQIGEELFISEHTAANHIRSILRKTSCANRTEAATYAHRHGLAEGPTEA